MSVNDGFGILVGFAVIGGILLGEIRWRQMKRKPVVERTAKRVRRRKDDDESEFEPDDIDHDVDEMPDDSLIYDIFN